MEGGPGAFGGGKAGAAQDPISFVQRPAVIIRVCSLVRKRKIIILLHVYTYTVVVCAPCLHCKAIQTFLKGHWNEMKRTFLRGELLTTLSIPPPRSPNLPLPFLSSP